jgi:hypothetical protein
VSTPTTLGFSSWELLLLRSSWLLPEEGVDAPGTAWLDQRGVQAASARHAALTTASLGAYVNRM